MKHFSRIVSSQIESNFMYVPIQQFNWLPAFDELVTTLANQNIQFGYSTQPISSLEFCDLRVIKQNDRPFYFMPLSTYFQLHDDVVLTPEPAEKYIRQFTNHNDAIAFILNDLICLCSIIPQVQRIDLLDRLFLKNRRGQLPLLRNPELLTAFRLRLGLPIAGYVSVGTLCEKLGLSDQSRSLKNHRHYRNCLNRTRCSTHKIGQQGATK